MYNFNSIIQTREHDVLLVRWLHLISLAFLTSGHVFKPHFLHYFLTFCADLTQWPYELTVGPAWSGRRAKAAARGRWA
jgi:hypothetical protein